MALEKAKDIVASNPAVVFGKSSCTVCQSVKIQLEQLGATYKTVELDQESDGSEIESALLEWTGLSNDGPNVFIGGKVIGGCNEMTALHMSGSLVQLLTGAGAIAVSTSSATEST